MSKELFMQQREDEMNGQNLSKALTFTKENQDVIANNLVSKVLDGEENPILAWIQLRSMQASIEKALEAIRGIAIDEGAKLPKQGDKVAGVHVSVTNGRRTWDYSNDSLWVELKEKIKQREEFLKGLTKPMADMDTGEVINPPIIKYSGDSLVLKFD